MTGTVSTYYALESFAESRAPVKNFMTRYAKMTGGINTSQQIKSYNGDLRDIPQPLPKDYVLKILNGMGLSQGKSGIIGAPDVVKQYDIKTEETREKSGQDNR